MTVDLSKLQDDLGKSNMSVTGAKNQIIFEFRTRQRGIFTSCHTLMRTVTVAKLTAEVMVVSNEQKSCSV